MIEKMLDRDLLVKAAAIVLAVVMWIQVINDHNPIQTRVMNFQVDLKSDALSGKTITYSAAQQVAVTLEGRAKTLDRINPDKVKVSVDLTSAGLGHVTVPVIFTAPVPGVKVIDISPKAIPIDVDALDSKSVGVNIVIRGTPNEDFDAEAPIVSVSSVKVLGPRKTLDLVQSVVGEVDVTAAAAPVASTVALVAKDAAGNDVASVSVDPPELQVTVPLKAKPPAKTVPIKVDTQGTPKAGYRVKSTSVTPQSIRIRGSTQVTKDIDSIHTRPVDVAGRDASFSAAVALSIPPGVSADITKVTANVEIEEDIVERTFTNVMVQPEALPVGFSFSISPPTVDITLRGRSDILSQVSSKDVEAYIDASWIDVSGIQDKGQFNMVVIPRGVQDVNGFDIKPSSVTLTLTRR